MSKYELLINFISVMAISFVLTVIISKIVIPILRGHKIGQEIRAEGPASHRSKAGTPTMGGICFIMAMLIALAAITVVYALRDRQNELIPLALTLGLALANGLVGFIDDYCKLIKKQNEGLKTHQKFILQFIVAIAYIVVMHFVGRIDTSLELPFCDYSIDLGYAYYPILVLFIVYIVNSVNLTDGLDGLATSVTIIVSAFFAVVAFGMLYSPLILLSAALIGGLLGFLIFNAHPAKVFMGDTGSLFLGGAVSGAALMINEPIILLIAGGIYVIESLSVILQVSSFKLRNKRIFKMAPIHHHFEKCDWSEVKIVAVFSIITAILSAIAWFAI